MPNEDFSMANPYLQQSEDGHAFIASPEPDNSRPSLEASGRPQGQARGIGGTSVSADRRLEQPNLRPAPGMAQGKSSGQSMAKSMSPAEMLIMADQMEQDFMDKTRAAENPYGSSLESSIDRGNSVQGNVPDWLHQYMSQQAPTDPYHQVPMSGLDMAKQSKYLSEQERLRAMKAQRR